MIWRSDTEIVTRWQDAWPQALETWSKYTRLRDAILCVSHVKAANEGLEGSFAMIRLSDQSVVVDLESIAELGLADYAKEILAHEIGHHILAPGTMTNQFRLLARIRRGLPSLEQYVPMVANLYTDLIINDYLQRQSGLRMGEVYQKIANSSPESKSAKGVWNLYLRIYENLWKLDSGTLGGVQGGDKLEGDAWLGARLIRVYANDWILGAGRFAALLLSYLVEETQEKSQKLIYRLLDTRNAAAGCEPYGGLSIEDDEFESIIHPSEDAEITGMEAETTGISADQHPVEKETNKKNSGQLREPYEYGEILRASGIKLSDHEIAIRYYRERAIPYLVPFPRKCIPDSPEPLLEGLEPWDIGDPFDEVDWMQSIMQSPKIIPGLTTVRRTYGSEEGKAFDSSPVDLDLYVDSSGSMPNPQRETSYPALAGAIIALSALRAGSSVQVTLWSGKHEFMHTKGFVRNDHEILHVLTGFYGRGTCFPIHRLRETFCGETKRTRPAHILMISDDGICTMFDTDEKGNSGWTTSAQALAAAGGGGSMALNITSNWDSEKSTSRYCQQLQRASQEQGWEISAVNTPADLVEFARLFSRRHYT